MLIFNYTPHTITLPNVKIEPSGIIARCDEITYFVTTIHGIDMVNKRYGDVENLPPFEQGKIYIVSFMVRNALPDRKDILSPGDLIRNEAGEIIGCKNLVQNE